MSSVVVCVYYSSGVRRFGPWRHSYSHTAEADSLQVPRFKQSAYLVACTHWYCLRMAYVCEFAELEGFYKRVPLSTIKSKSVGGRCPLSDISAVAIV